MALSDLEMLVKTWRAYIDANPAPDDFSRESGYIAGLTLCAQQVESAIERMKSDE